MVSAFSIASVLVASIAMTAVAAPATVTDTVNTPKGNVIAHVRPSGPFSVTAASEISYHLGAPVITAPLNLYYIYYGAWSDSQKSIVEDFATGLGSSDWYGITKEYYFQQDANSPKVYVDGRVTLAKSVVDNYSLGKSLSGNALPNIIQAQVDAGALPEDTNAIYVVLTSGDVQEKIRSDLGNAGFCTDYCGYHVSWQLKSGKRVYYAMIGNPTACLNGCAPPNNQASSPNGDVGVDALLSALAHEITEAVSDPWSDGTRAWEDTQGYENGDKCAYNYGTTQKDSNGAAFNVAWSGRNFLIQQNWDPVSQNCRLSPAGGVPPPTTTTSGVPPPTTTATATATVTKTKTKTKTKTTTTTDEPSPTPTPGSCDPNNVCCQLFGYDC